MRGWHNEPQRHSLAARGVPSKYFYHGTTSALYRGIKKDGLKINPPFKYWRESDDFVYLAFDEEDAERWGRKATEFLIKHYDEIVKGYVPVYYREAVGKRGVPGFISKTRPIVLRIDKDYIMEYEDLLFEDPEDDVAFLSNIPPEYIEVKTPSGWKRLKK